MNPKPLLIPFVAGLIAGVAPILTPAGRNLEYEAVTASATLVATLWPLYAIWTAGPVPSPRSLTFWNGVALFAGLAFPGTLMFALRVCPCSPSGYGQWLIIQALPSCILAASAAAVFLASRARHGEAARTFRARLRLTAAWLGIILASLAFLSALLWFLPQKRAVHILLGFLHGPIYDERIWIHRDVYLARLGHAFFFVSLGLAAARFKPIVTSAFLAAAAALALITWNSPATGHGNRVLQRQFPKVIEGDGFRLFHHDAAYLAPQVSFHIRDLKAILGPLPFPRIDVYAYPDARSKKLWFGGGATDITDVWTPGIHISTGIPGADHPTLRHELVHALTSEVAFHGLGFHPNMAITEGLAVALAPDANIFNVMSIDEAAAELIDSGRVHDPVSLFSPWAFWLESGPRAYTVAGSLAGWLKKTRGIDTVIALYSGKGWRQATGADTGEIISAWHRDISTHAASQANPGARRLRAGTLFRSAGVTLDVCPHSFADRMAASPDVESLEYMARHTRDPVYAVLARRQQAREIFTRGDRGAARSRAQDLARESIWPPRHEEDIELRIMALDLAAFGGSSTKITPDIDELAAFHAGHPLPSHLARQILVRQRLREVLAPQDAQAWIWYLAGWGPVPPLRESRAGGAGVQPWVVDYLRVRNWLRAGVPVEGIPQITAFIDKKIDPVLAARDPAFAFEWYRSLAELLDEGKSHETSRPLWLKAAAAASNATVRDRMEQNARRAAFSAVP